MERGDLGDTERRVVMTKNVGSLEREWGTGARLMDGGGPEPERRV